jgi:hypothetical protein
MKLSIAAVLWILLAVVVYLPDGAAAKSKSKDPCRKADLRLARTGQGDSDGDGISDCREARLLRTSVEDRDTDRDGLEDGDEMKASCDPHDNDSDDDGIEDGDDETPAVEQEVKALLDAITCPVPEQPELPAVPGSITALGVTATLDAETEFEKASCEELVTLLGGEESVLVEIEILEDVLGALTATEVELEKPCRDQKHDD